MAEYYSDHNSEELSSLQIFNMINAVYGTDAPQSDQQEERVRLKLRFLYEVGRVASDKLHNIFAGVASGRATIKSYQPMHFQRGATKSLGLPVDVLEDFAAEIDALLTEDELELLDVRFDQSFSRLEALQEVFDEQEQRAMSSLDAVIANHFSAFEARLLVKIAFLDRTRRARTTVMARDLGIDRKAFRAFMGHMPSLRWGLLNEGSERGMRVDVHTEQLLSEAEKQVLDRLIAESAVFAVTPQAPIAEPKGPGK